MKRRYNSQIMPPKITGPGTGTPLILNDDSPISEMTRNSTAMTTGAPVASAMNTVRRDHNICPSDMSNTRRTAVQNFMTSPDIRRPPAGCRRAT